MLTVLLIALAYAGVRAWVAAAVSWRAVPRSNDDMVFF
jgi:hypothetical protein